ncbi:MAG TPA: hypothetical protein VNW52_02730 [Burkholderiaceae bacterium]|nr:hypothetical protein [Burkholderiaceae bacterium]
MKIGFIIVSIAFLMSLGMQSAHAGPFGRIREAREQARAGRQQRAAQEERPQAQAFPRGGQNPVFAPPMPGTPGPVNAYGQPNQVRKFGPRMSIEDRQRLRRQINEAGQDIYTPQK